MLSKNRLFVFLFWMVLLLGSPAGIRDSMAVSLSATGTGETLLFPYYTTRNGYNTYLTLTNTTNSGKAVRINFREAYGGKLVLGFNAYLSANDQWSAAVIMNAYGGARMISADKSCTAPQIPSSGVDLVNYAYQNPSDVFAITSLDRTTDGYLEVIEMGRIPPGSQFESNITPVNGVPRDCSWVVSQVFSGHQIVGSGEPPFVLGGTLSLNAPTGGLTGKAELISLINGLSFFPHSALAFNQFLAGARHTITYDDLNLDSAAPVATISGHLTNWPRGVDAVSAVLATKKIFGSFALDAWTLGATNLITFSPTRPFYAGGAPFSVAEPGCEPTGLSIFDSSGTTTFNMTAAPTLCRVASILDFGSYNILDAPWATSLSKSNIGTERGSFSLELNSTATTTTASSSVIWGGLPVVGLVLQENTIALTSGISKYTSALYAATDFNVFTFRTPVGSREDVDTLIRFAPGDIGKSGSIFITASIPSDKLSILSGTLAHALNSKVASAKPLAVESAAMVQVQLTSTGWQSVSNGQYVPFITGVYGDLLAAQNILKNTDTTSLAGAKFCLGYGTSAAEMVEAGRMTTILTLQGATVSDSCIVTGTPTTISPPICTLTATPISAGGTSTLTASCSPAATAYVWSSNTGFASTAASGSVSPTITTTYTVAGSNSAGSGPVVTATVAVTTISTAIEFYKSDIGHYFMTASTEEATALDNKPEWNWVRTGKRFNIWPTQASAPGNASPVCRFFGVFANGTVGSHFYTVDATECAYVKGRLDWGWVYENDAFYAVKPTSTSCPTGTTPIYRAYNNSKSGAPNHRYMVTQADVATMVSQGWVSEGTAFCGVQ